MSFVRRLFERFWFVPATMCLLAAGAAVGLVAVDQATGEDPGLPRWVSVLLYRVGSSGSRDLLGAIATSSLAVAGTTFSITMAVLALTSSTYGPRLVRNFMADRGNQVVLAVYVSTFVYCLLVLRSIRVLGDPGQQDAEVFVPHLAVNVAVLLAVANVAVLIYFIHHISDSVQVSTLASGVRDDLRDVVDRLYPEEVGHGEPELDARGEVPALEGQGRAVQAGRAGYVQSVSHDGLIRTAVRHDVVVDLQVGPGEYVLADTVVARVHRRGPLPTAAEEVSEEVVAPVRRAVPVTDARTPYQDVDFAVQQLTEMAVRALSPGTNDPYTAVNALDDLSAGLARLATREAPSPWRRDGEGTVRVHAPGRHVTDLAGAVLDQVRWYGAGAPQVMHSCLDLIQRVGSRTGDDALRASLLGHVDLLVDAFSAAEPHPHDLEGFHTHADRARRVLQGSGVSG